MGELKMELKYELRNGWKVINEMNNMANVLKYSKEYMDFLNKGKIQTNEKSLISIKNLHTPAQKPKTIITIYTLNILISFPCFLA